MRQPEFRQLLFFQRVFIMRFLLTSFAMHGISFLSELAVRVLSSVISKGFLARHYSGFATLAAELVRSVS